MAVIPNSIGFPGMSADRATRTVLARWVGAAADVLSKSSVCSLISSGAKLAIYFVIDFVTTLNGGTVSAGAFTVELSNDGVNWTDSGIAPVVVTAAGAHLMSLSTETAGSLMPARFVRVNLSTAIAIAGNTLQVFEIGITVQ